MTDLDEQIYFLKRRIRFAEIGWPLSTGELARMPQLKSLLMKMETERIEILQNNKRAEQLQP